MSPDPIDAESGGRKPRYLKAPSCSGTSHARNSTFALNEQKATGIVEIGRRRICVLDDARLAEMIDGH